MVGRVWPRHGHRGRPLNSIVRHHVKRAPLICAMLASVAYFAVWLLIAAITIAKENPDGLLMLTYFTTPSSLAVLRVLLFLGAATNVVAGLAGFLIAGVVQYGFVGYIIGFLVRGVWSAEA